MAQSVPHLTALLPYLEVSSDQPYLLSRVRLLAKTGALSLFRWNGGGDGWTDRLPSDAELLVHCLACYFDARLLTSASMRLSGTTNPQAEVITSRPPIFVEYTILLSGDETFHWCPLLSPRRETCGGKRGHACYCSSWSWSCTLCGSGGHQLQRRNQL